MALEGTWLGVGVGVGVRLGLGSGLGLGLGSEWYLEKADVIFEEVECRPVVRVDFFKDTRRGRVDVCPRVVRVVHWREDDGAARQHRAGLLELLEPPQRGEEPGSWGEGLGVGVRGHGWGWG